MPSILFICTANQFRSPLAAACLLKTIEKENPAGTWIVESAGAWTCDGLAAPQITRQAARRMGLAGIDRHLTRQIGQDLLDQFDLLIVMETDHKEAISIEFPSVRDRLYLLSEIVDGIRHDIPDPADPGVHPNTVTRELNRLISRGKEKILQLAASLSAASLHS